MKMGSGGCVPGYNIQLTTAVGSGAVKAVGVADCGSDFGRLLPAVEQHRRRLGRYPARLPADSCLTEHDDLMAPDTLECEVLVPDERGAGKNWRKDPALDRWRARISQLESIPTYNTVRPAIPE